MNNNGSAGREAARLIDSLFDSWGPSLYRYAFRLGGSRELAEDAVQEAFMALYRQSVCGKGVDNPRGWTLCVVRQQISRHRRDQRRHGEELQPSDALDALSARDNEQAEGGGEADLPNLLSVLTRREEEVVLLRMESLKYREIASQLGVSSKTVGALLARALEKLKRAARMRSKDDALFDKREAHVPATLQ